MEGAGKMKKKTRRSVLSIILCLIILGVAGYLGASWISERWEMSKVCGLYKLEGKTLELKGNGKFNLKESPVYSFTTGKWELGRETITLSDENGFALKGRISKKLESFLDKEGPFCGVVEALENLTPQGEQWYAKLESSRIDKVKSRINSFLGIEKDKLKEDPKGYEYWCITDEKGRIWKGPKIN